MKKRTRTILFFASFFLFLLVTPYVILYSQGYRIDLKERRITKTGAFYFKISPKGGDIFINGKLKKKTDFLFNSALVENLLPRKYEVEIRKNGFYPWKKNLEVLPGLVTEAKNIYLIPKEVNFEILAKNVEKFFPSASGRKIILKETDDNGWYLEIYDTEKKVKGYLISKTGISEEPDIELLDVMWSDDEKGVILRLRGAEEKYLFLEPVNNSTGLIAMDFLPEKIKNLSFNPKNSLRIFFLIEKNGFTLFEGDLERKTIHLLLTDIIAYQIYNDKIYWLSKEGELLRSDFAGQSETLTSEPFPLKNDSGYQIVIVNSKIFLKNEGVIFLFNEESKKIEQIARETKDLRVSYNLKKIVLWSSAEIWVFCLKTEEEQPEKVAGEKTFLIRLSESIGRVYWLTDHYLIFDAGSEIKIIEIDDRDRVQNWTITSFQNPEIFFNQKNKELFVLNEGSFYSLRLFPGRQY